MFDFINRKREFQTLQESFLDHVLKNRGCLSYLVQGRRGIGKSRLIQEFIAGIEADKRIASQIPKFRQRLHVIEYECSQEASGPYLPFVEISKQMQERQKAFRILRQIGMLAISFLPIHDMIEDFLKLGTAINSGETAEAVQARETRLFRKYLKIVKQKSESVPLVIYIKNVQWIDDHSLELLHTLIDTENSMWGMIILEQDEEGAVNPNIGAVFNRLIEDGALSRLTLQSMQKGFEMEMLESRFAPQLFTTTEYEHIYTITEGSPGLLVAGTEDWLRKGWLYQQDDMWCKVEGFENKIKAPQQKLLDLLITLLQDGVISARERILINNFAEEWGISADVVSSLTDMLLKTQELGYTVERRVHSGAISKDAFLAVDKNRNPFLVEYVTDVEKTEKVLAPREVKHPHLLGAREIKQFQNGVLIVNDYLEGKTLKEIKIEAYDSHIKNALKTAAQAAEGLAEMHRNNLVHGAMRPESILVTTEGDIRLTGLDAAQLTLREAADDDWDISSLVYLSPEQINQEKADARSDVFSFGVLLYELLTGELPFHGKSKSEIKQAIRFDPVPPFDHLKARIPQDVQNLLLTCLHKNPEQRFQNAAGLLNSIREVLYKTSDDDLDGKEFSETPERVRSGVSRKKRLFAPLVIAGLIVSAALFCWFRGPCKPHAKVVDALVVGELQMDQTSDTSSRLTPDMMKYLLVDDLLQSSDVTVMDEKEFRFLHPEKSVPRLFIDGAIYYNGVNYDVNLRLTAQEGGSTEKQFSFADPSALLTSKVSEMTQAALALVDVAEKKKSTFTSSWDAFESFYGGEVARRRLEPNRAEQRYTQSLDIDPDFVLAKLRLAGVLQFDGSNARAQQLVQSIHGHLGELSVVDSLKAEALTARLTGKVRREIDILRNIYNRYPTRKEAPYEVAEAYYAICDIKNAVDFYDKTLALDKNFARAHNHLAYCYSHLGEHDKALLHFKKYVALDSTANAYDSLGDGYMAAGKLDSAVWAKQQGIEQDPGLAYLYGALSYINIRQGQLRNAQKAVDNYFANSTAIDNQPNGYFRLALIRYCLKQYDKALVYAQKGRDVFDSMDIVTRNHELHWLLGLLYLQTGRLQEAKRELQQMEDLISANGVSSTNYRMGIYKYALHLNACLAAREGDLATVQEIIKEFDGPIHDKVKDHGSPFDLAFFYTSFGELLQKPPLNRPDLAQKQIDKALKYNANYAPAHYDKWSLQREDGASGDAELAIFKSLWKNADAEVLRMYEVGE